METEKKETETAKSAMTEKDMLRVLSEYLKAERH